MPQEPDDREYTPDESRLKTSFRECIPLFIALRQIDKGNG